MRALGSTVTAFIYVLMCLCVCLFARRSVSMPSFSERRRDSVHVFEVRHLHSALSPSSVTDFSAYVFVCVSVVFTRG